METISGYQLFVLTFLFQTGTTIVFGFASSAGRDAWIASLISTILALFIIILYTTLMRMHPGLTLVEWFPAQFGRWLGLPISWLYPILFLFDAGRTLSDLKYLIPSTILPNTPPLVSVVVFVIVVVYGLFKGIGNIARLGEILFPLILILFGVEVIFLFSSDILHIKYLQPMLKEGWEPIWEAVFPHGVLHGFGETLTFAMIWTMTKHPERVMKITIYSVILCGIILTIADILAIMVFDEGIFKHSIYPLYSLMGIVNVGGFINNLHPVGILYFSTTIFFKAVIQIFVAIRAIQQLTHMKDHRVLILPAAIILIFEVMRLSSNVSEHISVIDQKIFAPYVWIPLYVFLPSILLIVAWIKKAVRN